MLRDSLAACPVLGAKKTKDLFRKYDVLSPAEVESRMHIAIEKYVKQLTIEAETMISIARSQILPAAIEHQVLLAQSVSATEAASVECEDDHEALREFAGFVSRLRRAIVALEKACAHHVDDTHKHATHINAKVKPAMDALREVVDTLETHVAADLWPLPTYRELLFLK